MLEIKQYNSCGGANRRVGHWVTATVSECLAVMLVSEWLPQSLSANQSWGCWWVSASHCEWVWVPVGLRMRVPWMVALLVGVTFLPAGSTAWTGSPGAALQAPLPSLQAPLSCLLVLFILPFPARTRRCFTEIEERKTKVAAMAHALHKHYGNGKEKLSGLITMLLLQHNKEYHRFGRTSMACHS